VNYAGYYPATDLFKVFNPLIFKYKHKNCLKLEISQKADFNHNLSFDQPTGALSLKALNYHFIPVSG